jgi:hypothetical protein
MYYRNSSNLSSQGGGPLVDPAIKSAHNRDCCRCRQTYPCARAVMVIPSSQQSIQEQPTEPVFNPHHDEHSSLLASICKAMKKPFEEAQIQRHLRHEARLTALEDEALGEQAATATPEERAAVRSYLRDHVSTPMIKLPRVKLWF